MEVVLWSICEKLAWLLEPVLPIAAAPKNEAVLPPLSAAINPDVVSLLKPDISLLLSTRTSFESSTIPGVLGKSNELVILSIKALVSAQLISAAIAYCVKALDTSFNLLISSTRVDILALVLAIWL